MPIDFPLDVEQLQRVLDRLNLGIYITDRERRIVLWNRKAEEITGHRAADVVGRPCHDGVLEHNDKDGHQLCTSRLCPLHRTMELNKESEHAILVFAKKADDSRLAVSVGTAPLHDDDGNVIGGIETFRDETARVRDLEFARKIQRHILPEELPQVDSLAFDVRYYPHDLVGGDFYDVRRLNSGSYGVLVADVMGHGVSAALYTMFLKSLSEKADAAGADPGQFLADVNRDLANLTLDESFATAFYAVVDPATHAVAYSSAGHPGPLHYRPGSGAVDTLQTIGLPLGVDEDADYDVEQVTLDPGDILVAFSDGIVEVRDTAGRMLNSEGFATLIADEAARSTRNLLERLYRRVLDLNADVSFADDVLLLSVMRTG